MAYDPSQKNIDLCASIPSYVKKLTDLVNKKDDTKTDIPSMAANVISGLAQEDNPFKEFPCDTSQNTWYCELDSHFIKDR